jgi:Xaa-Pro aminopeptidase
MKNRKERLLQEMGARGIDAALITSPENRRYFSGFTGTDGMIFIHPETSFLITDFRYIEQGNRQCPGFKVVDAPGNKAGEYIKGLCDSFNIKNIWFEDESLSCKLYRSLSEAIKPTSLIPDDGISSKLRMIKSADEIENMKRAAEIADRGFAHMLNIIEVGMTELEAALELEFFLRINGSEGLAFPTIAASGPNSAMPHAEPQDKKLQPGDFFTLDYGGVVNGYCSDMTRTVAIGRPSDKLKEIYEIALEAQLLTLDFLKPGVSCLEADKAARDYIERMGYGECFGHGLGHGVGLLIHEAPTLSPRGTEILAPGMVVTIEPGIYLPGLGGVRIEDMVVITENGSLNLTSSPKELIII